MNIDFLIMCPNVRHVVVHGFEKANLDVLVNLLKEKALVFFFITPDTISDVNQHSRGPRVGRSFN